MGEPIIQFDHFGFQYNAQAEPTLFDINLTVRRGEKILIAGASGSGSSATRPASRMASTEAPLCAP